MLKTYSDIVAAVKRAPRFAEVDAATALDRLQDTLTDVIMQCPEASVRLFANPIVVSISTAKDEVVIGSQVSQVLAVYLRKSADSSAYIRLMETNFASLNNDTPTWTATQAGTPEQWYITFLRTGEMAIGLYPRLSSTVVSSGYDRLYVYAAAPDYDITGADLSNSDPIPWALYPGWVLEAGLAYRLANDFDPANSDYYKAIYDAEVRRVQNRILTMPERMKAPTISNARSY